MFKFLEFICRFSLFYDPEQTNREMFAEFRGELRKDKEARSLITSKTFDSLSPADKTIIMRFSKNFRKCNNKVFLSLSDIGYSEDGIKYRLRVILNKLKHNIKN